MDQRRIHVIKLIVALLFLLLVLVLNLVEAERDGTINDHHNLILDVADEIEDEEFDTEAESEHLRILSQISTDNIQTQSLHNAKDSLDSSDELGQLGDELLVEEDLEPVYADSEDYEEAYTSAGPEFNELPHCPQEKEQDATPRPAVVISTLDGRVTSLDVSTGAVLWSHQTGGKNNEMLSSSMSKLEVTSRGDLVRLIPSLDGGIYRCDGDVVEALPVTAETLLHSSFKFNSETIFTGGKSTEVWGLALDTGKPVYICNASGCKRQRTASKPAQLLVVKRITQIVRAVDPKSGDERWNFSVGQHEVNVAGGGCDWMDAADISWEDLPSLHFIIPEGVVMGMDPESQLVWQQKLTSPVVSAWKVINGELEQIDLFSTNSVPALTPDNSLPSSQYRAQGRDDQQQPALYVGVHHKQLYIQQSGGMRNKFNSAFKIFSTGLPDEGGGPNEVSFPRVHWRPYLATALSRTPVVNVNDRKHPLLTSLEIAEEVTAVAIPHQVDYPYDNGYFLYADENNGQLNFSGPWEVPVIEEESLMDDVTSHIIRICFQIGPDTWVKLACAIVFYTALHFLLLRWIMVQMRRQLTNQAVKFITMMLHHIIQNNPHIIAIIQRLGVQLPQLHAPPPAPPQDQLPSLPNNNNSETSKAESPLFSSRYQTDFKPIQCLGRGGFGVVFQVYNNLDENEYAVKRITLPSKEASSERVKREVRALAKLNHTNIVRYYNSWLESPPFGWQDGAEFHWKHGDALSNTVFTPGAEESYERGSENVLPVKEIEELSKDSLSEELLKMNNPQLTDYSSKFSTWSENESLDNCDDSADNSVDDESDTSAEYSKQWCSEKLQDNSVDIVFSNSESNTSTKNVGGEDSFEIVFERSKNSPDVHSDKSEETSVNKQDSVSLCKRQNFELQTDDSQSIAFVDSSLKESGKVLHTTECSTSAYSSQSNNENIKSQEFFISDKNVKRRRVQSQPVQTNVTGGDERPRTLSLGTTITDVDASSNVKVEHQLPKPKTFLYIQMELCQKESLKDWLLKNCYVRQEKIIFSMFNDIVRAVEYVHDNQLMHRDLKPSNIFFSLDGEIKIGDFGLVTTITEGEQEIRTPADCNPSVLSNNRHTHRVGTQLYMSPEQVNNQVYDYKVDIYSLGLIFFEMIVPFSTGMERLSVMTSLRDGKFPDGFCDKYPDETELLKMMLSTNPASRPTTRGIRARNPLRALQGSAVNDIPPEDHFRLNRQRSHVRSHSGSSFSFTSSASSS